MLCHTLYGLFRNMIIRVTDRKKIDLKDKVMQLLGNMNGEDFRFAVLDLSALSAADKQVYFASATQSITIQARIRFLDEKALQEITESNYRSSLMSASTHLADSTGRSCL